MYMKFRGGYNIDLSNGPAERVDAADTPNELFIPLCYSHFNFSDIKVENGQTVKKGEILAIDPENYNLPVLAPMSGTVQIDETVITLSKLSKDGCAGTSESTGSAKLMAMGAWRYFENAFSRKPANPDKPDGVILKLVDLDSFVMTSQVDLIGNIDDLCSGIEKIAELAGDAKVYIIISRKQAKSADIKPKSLAGKGNIEVITIPDKYGQDNAALLADKIGFNPDQNIWSVTTQGIFAVDTVINKNQFSVDLMLSYAGPGVKDPRYIKAPVGYPLAKLTDGDNTIDESVRLIDGGVLTGRTIQPEEKGLAINTVGVTVLSDSPKRKFLKFAMLGMDNLRFSKKMTTALEGEIRACIQCGYCQEVCPAGLMPDYLHKLLYAEDIDKADVSGLQKCVRCGLCSYICVSKIDLTEEFIQAQDHIAAEKAEHAALEAAKKAKEAKEAAEKEQEVG